MQQFNELYYTRLSALKPFVLEQAQQRWGGRSDVHHTAKVLNVEGPTLTYIIGTLFIDSNAKPSTLHMAERTHWIADAEESGKYRDETAVVHLEDESGRIGLTGSELSKATIASGVVAAVLGAETPDGRFDVAEMCFAGMPDQPELPKEIADDRFVAFVSGFNATIERPLTLEMQLLAEYLAGNLGSEQTQRESAQIVQVVVAGGLVELPTPPLGHTEDPKANDRLASAKLVSQIDEYLADIASSVPLVVMPGRGDPTDVSMPQQPMNPGMFAQCRQYSGFLSTTNPASLAVDGVTLLGTAGQNVDDLKHYTINGESACELAARSLQWRHIAPTAPDTLWCYPFTTSDPFILRQAPHVYFVGNQQRASAAWAPDVHGGGGSGGARTRVVTVPRFRDNYEIALLNLRTMEYTSVCIGAKSASTDAQ
ncbi:DNA polymerase alpha/epsilon subunit B-domain-containing protein [Coemansia spiralis]|nr:DNA polymerase alpha/epsilon subunit B-domain-containing protein [Coemansia spiralis]